MEYLVLQGGSEFSGQMHVSDSHAITLAGGFDAQISIVPAAAAPDGNHHRSGQRGRRWFESIGARQVTVLPLIDRACAERPEIALRLRRSNLIYLLGGFPGYLADALRGTRSWQAIRAALHEGAILAGSSAGAMVIGQVFYDPLTQNVVKGLGLLQAICIVPHFNTFGRRWISRLQKELPSMTLIGIDEETGAINDGPEGIWSVYGKGIVTVFHNRRKMEYGAGEQFGL